MFVIIRTKTYKTDTECYIYNERANKPEELNARLEACKAKCPTYDFEIMEEEMAKAIRAELLKANKEGEQRRLNIYNARQGGVFYKGTYVAGKLN